MSPRYLPTSRQTDAESARIRTEQKVSVRALLATNNAADLLEVLGIRTNAEMGTR